MWVFWLLTCILGLLIWLMYSKFTDKPNYWDKRGVFCKQSGSFIALIKNMLFSKGLTDYVLDTYKDHDGHKYFGYFVFRKPFLILRDPEIINLVLVKDFSYFQDRNLPMNEKTELLNAGLANVTGEKWRVLRHRLTPTFTSGKMKIMFDEMKNCSKDMVSFINKKKGDSLEARDILFKFIINVIGITAFGIKVDALNEDMENSNKFVQMTKKFFQPSPLLRFKLTVYLVAPKLKEWLGLKMVDNEVNEFFPKLVKDLIFQRKQNNIKRNDFLQLLINEQEREQTLFATDLQNNKSSLGRDLYKDQEQEPEDLELLQNLENVKYDKDSLVFSDNTIAAQAFLFVSGGSDTTAAVLSFAVHELAMHQDIQRKLQKEIDCVLSNNDFNYEDVKKMKYLQQFLYEVLRFRTQGTIVTRMCVKDYNMPGTDLIIEKGTFVQIPVIGLHMDPQYFPDPEKFDPDRFEDMDSIPKGVFFPFGGGPRICIAMRLAMLEMKVFLVTLLRSCNVLHSEKTKMPLEMCKNSFSQHVKGGLWVKFEERQQNNHC